MTGTVKTGYHPTESKYKGGAHEMYVTYDLAQSTRSGKSATLPKVQRVYIAGDVKDWEVGTFAKRTGRSVNGVKIDYRQDRAAYARRQFSAQRRKTTYNVAASKVGRGSSTFSKIVEVPPTAQNVRFRRRRLPAKYQHALQRVR